MRQRFRNSSRQTKRISYENVRVIFVLVERVKKKVRENVSPANVRDVYINIYIWPVVPYNASILITFRSYKCRRCLREKNIEIKRLV